jgi:Fe2+ transport system protein FeoA
MTTLDQLAPGRGGRILGVDGADPVGQRLMELGLIEGARVEVVRLAPLGDPMELRLAGMHLSVRKAEAARVKVEPCA